MMDKAPLVSVIMPAYNMERFITSAIRSVQQQTLTDWELLVIDDGSSDGTCAIVQELADGDNRIHLLRNEANMGVARTRNRGLDLCQGQYVAFLDSDDLWQPRKLECQLARFQETEADLVYTSYGIVDAQGEKLKADYLVPGETSLNGLLKENVIGLSTVMLSRQIADGYRFVTDFYHEDYVLWLQLLKENRKAVGCTQVLTQWRCLENSRSFNKKKSAGNRWRIYREYLNMPLPKSIWMFGNYAVAGVRKHFFR